MAVGVGKARRGKGRRGKGRGGQGRGGEWVRRQIRQKDRRAGLNLACQPSSPKVSPPPPLGALPAKKAVAALAGVWMGAVAAVGTAPEAGAAEAGAGAGASAGAVVLAAGMVLLLAGLMRDWHLSTGASCEGKRGCHQMRCAAVLFFFGG